MPDSQPLPFRRRATVLVVLWVTLAVLPILFPAAILPFAGSALIADLVAPILHWLTGQRVFGRAIARWVAILFLYAVFFLLIYLFIIAIVPQLYREMVRISSNAFSFARSLTPERVQEIAPPDPVGLLYATATFSANGRYHLLRYRKMLSHLYLVDLQKPFPDIFVGVKVGEGSP